MLSKQLAALAVVFVFLYIISGFVVGVIFGPVGEPHEEVKQVDPISAEFDPLDPRVFNDNAINPTQLIEIKESNNKSVFSIGQEEE